MGTRVFRLTCAHRVMGDISKSCDSPYIIASSTKHARPSDDTRTHTYSHTSILIYNYSHFEDYNITPHANQAREWSHTHSTYTPHVTVTQHTRTHAHTHAADAALSELYAQVRARTVSSDRRSRLRDRLLVHAFYAAARYRARARVHYVFKNSPIDNSSSSWVERVDIIIYIQMQFRNDGYLILVIMHLSRVATPLY